MLLRSALLVAAWLLTTAPAQAQSACPAPTNLKVSHLTATSATLAYEGTAGNGSVFGSYTYPGGPKLAVTPAGAGTLLLAALPPATPITVSLYMLYWNATSRVSNTYSAVATYTFTTPAAASTQEASALAALTLAPNPAHATTTLRLPLVPGATHATLHLRDALGREVRTLLVPLGEAAELNLTDLRSGVYLVQAQANGQQTVRRLVVE